MRQCSCFLLCAYTVLCVSLSSYCDQVSTISVKGIEGRGKNRQLALSDAFRNAISQALGTYVVTSRQWDGETLDKKIFDNSDAVVKAHKVVSENETNGKWSLTIDAEIVRNEMMRYVQKETSTQVGEGELANLLAKRNAINNAVGSLELLFQNWRENIYRVEKYGNISISDQDVVGSDTVHISVPFIVTFRWDTYRIFLNKVRNVLSRIAIGKANGEFDSKVDEDFRKQNYQFYNKMGLAYKTNYGIETKNPNGYGEIRIVSHLSENRIQYEIYIVPGQVKATLDSLLQQRAEIKFTFMSRGGAIIASRVVRGEVFFWGWNRICDDEISLGWSSSHGGSLITMMDVIKTDLGHEEWSDCKLYHGSIPVPLDSASLISGCNIIVCSVRENQDCYGKNHITVESMDVAEWRRIDKNPQTRLSTDAGIPANTNSRSAVSGVRPSVATQVAAIGHAEPIIISEKDKMLKGEVEGFSRLPPDLTSAGKWFKFAKELESRELRQLVLRTASAALVVAKRQDIYNSKVRPLLKDASSFERVFLAECLFCKGAKSIAKQCSACTGSGVCRYGNCNGGRRIVRRITGSYYERCSVCKGSGRCQKCCGTGRTSTCCTRCKGKGKSFSSDFAAEIYNNCVERICEAFR